MAIDRVRVTEQSTKVIEFDILDQDSEAVPFESLTAATLTLYDVDTGLIGASPAPGILNGRDQQDVLASGSPALEGEVSITDAGHVTWVMQPEDSVIVTTRRQVERHRAMFHFEWATGSFNYELEIEVVNLRMAS